MLLTTVEIPMVSGGLGEAQEYSVRDSVAQR